MLNPATLLTKFMGHPLIREIEAQASAEETQRRTTIQSEIDNVHAARKVHMVRNVADGKPLGEALRAAEKQFEAAKSACDDHTTRHINAMARFAERLDRLQRRLAGRDFEG